MEPSASLIGLATHPLTAIPTNDPFWESLRHSPTSAIRIRLPESGRTAHHQFPSSCGRILTGAAWPLLAGPAVRYVTRERSGQHLRAPEARFHPGGARGDFGERVVTGMAKRIAMPCQRFPEKPAGAGE